MADDKDPKVAGTKKPHQVAVASPFKLKEHKPILLCDLCSYQTQIERLYQCHVAKHSLDQPFQCPDCEMSDYDHSSFVDHLVDHQQSKILRCCFCEYKSGIVGMRLHMAKHRAIEPYDCSLCEFSSKHPNSMKTHVDSFHTKTFACNYCKKIMTKYTLIKHIEKVHGVNIKNFKREQLVAVNTSQDIIEDDSLVMESDDDTARQSSGNIPLEEGSLRLLLPVPQLVLKRINFVAAVHSEELTIDVPQVDPLDTHEIFQDSPVSLEEQDGQDWLESFGPESNRSKITESLHTVPNEICELHISKYDNFGACDDKIHTEPERPDTLLGTKNPDATSGKISSQPANPNVDTAMVSPEPKSPETNDVCYEPTCPDDDTYVVSPQPLSPVVDFLPQLETSDAHYVSSFADPGSSIMTHEPTNPDFIIMPQPLSPDTDPFHPESMIEIEEEIDIKPDLDALIKMNHSETKRLKTKYYCNDCDFSTYNKTWLRQHAPKHLLNPNFVCTDCEFEEPSRYIFAKHLASRRTQSAKLIHCCFCEHTSKHVKSMSCHLKKHKPVLLDDCPKCGTVFPSKLNLKDHYRVMHTQKWECHECGKWMSKYSLRKHRRTHVAQKRKAMKPTRAEGISSKGVMKVKYAVPGKPMYQCYSCNYCTRLKSLLRRHVVKHLLPGAELCCSKCNFMDTATSNFAAHLKQCHSIENSHDCCFCDYSTIDIRYLIGHLEIHRSVHFFDCAKCDKSYKHRSALSTHSRTFHFYKHQCTECGKIMTLSKLQQHKELHQVHNNADSNAPKNNNGNEVGSNTASQVPQAKYNCEFCKYATDIEILFTKHTAKHAMEEAYFICPICQYRDQFAYKFGAHLRSHFNDSPACCFCEYTTAKTKYLSAHLEIHRSVHFYDCPKCDKSFKSNGSLSTHRRTYHVEEHTCTDCGEIVTYHELLEHRKLHGPIIDNTLDMNSPDQEVFYDPFLFNCYHCAYTTKDKSLLRRHAVKHLLDARLVCPFCDFKQMQALEFAKHCISCQAGFNCSICPFTTNDVYNLAGHLEIHRPVLLYDCTECFYSCSSLSYLKTHFKNMHVAEHKCSQCGELLSRFELKQHRLKHRMPSLNMRTDLDASTLSVLVCEPGRLLCGYCDYSTDVQTLLDQHVAKHNSESDLVCPSCGFTSCSSHDFVRHLREHQLDKDVYACCFCSFATFHRGSFPDHIESHRSIHFYDCPKCDTTCSNKPNLKAHYEKFHVVEHVCPSCSVVVTYDKLLMHEEMHAVQNNPTYFCSDCQYKTKKKFLIRQHTARHLNSEFVCPKCLVREHSSDVFMLHLKTCFQSDTQCCFCIYTTSDASSLLQHLDVHLSVPVMLFDCSKCDKSFRMRSKLTEHIRLHHKDKHRCSICGKVMTYSRLIRHMKLHKKSGVGTRLTKRFHCNHCTFTTKRKSLLRRHAPKHLVDNRLSCTICHFKSNSSHSFGEHLRAHSSDNVIKCCFCDYSSSKRTLAYHVDQHRPVHFNDCWKCDKSYAYSNNFQTHFHKMHVQKHYCQKTIRPHVMCYKKMTLYRLQKHQSAEHKAASKEIHYYVCRGPIKKKELLGDSVPKVEASPVASTSSNMIEVQPDTDTNIEVQPDVDIEVQPDVDIEVQPDMDIEVQPDMDIEVESDMDIELIE